MLIIEGNKNPVPFLVSPYLCCLCSDICEHVSIGWKHVVFFLDVVIWHSGNKRIYETMKHNQLWSYKYPYPSYSQCFYLNIELFLFVAASDILLFFICQIPPILRMWKPTSANARNRRPLQGKNLNAALSVQDQTSFQSQRPHPVHTIKKVSVHSTWKKGVVL